MNLLINPTTLVQDGYAPPPLGLLYMAAINNDTVVFDAAIKGDPVPFIEQTKPKVVGVTLFTSCRKESLRILKAAKDNGAVTVAGGPHVAVMTKQLAAEYPFVDYLVVGDGELAWRDICAAEKLPRIIRKTVENLDTLPIPKWDAVDLSEYPARGNGIVQGVDLSRVPRVSIVVSRGCTGSCTFCSTWWVNGKFRTHGKEWMRNELQDLWDRGARHLVFQDDCMTANRQSAIDLCEVLSEFKFAWFGTTRVDAIDLDLAQRMKACGCYELSFGIESGSARILNEIHKKTDLEHAFEARTICHQVGIKFTALMMFGFPGETQEDLNTTWTFLNVLRPDAIGSIGHVGIFPGTAMYQQCKRDGLIDDSFWLGDEPYFKYPHFIWQK